MGKVVKNKRIISILVTLMMVLSLSFSAFADGSNDKNNSDRGVMVAYAEELIFHFRVRASGSYENIGSADIHCWNGSYSYIVLTKSVTFTTSKGQKVTLPKGTRWNIQLPSYKNGAKITLTFDKDRSPKGAESLVKKAKVETLTGKIHIDSKKAELGFWKLDSMGCGFYFRNS